MRWLSRKGDRTLAELHDVSLDGIRRPWHVAQS
jgi:hypothetical protein